MRELGGDIPHAGGVPNRPRDHEQAQYPDPDRDRGARLGTARVERVVGAERIDLEAHFAATGGMRREAGDNAAGTIMYAERDDLHAFAAALALRANGQPVGPVLEGARIERRLARQSLIQDRLGLIVEIDANAGIFHHHALIDLCAEYRAWGDRGRSRQDVTTSRTSQRSTRG